MKTYFYQSTSGDGWQNLSTDEYFLEHIQENEMMLYLYCNTNAVIIGKNQNPWKECNLSAMEEDGVQLVRRFTGGGAVYHDCGNLNFSFITHKDHYDISRQLKVIIDALAFLGISACFSGRNDLLAEGRKFSGNAFCTRGQNSLHHGTLMLDTDCAKLSHYLTVAPQKIQSKGIDSVKSRVINLTELCPNLTMDQMIQALQKAFAQEYGMFTPYEMTSAAKEEIASLYQKRSSWEWRLGRAPKFDITFSHWFTWGNMDLHLSFADGIISACKVYSDAINPDLAEGIASALAGISFSSVSMHHALVQHGEKEYQEIAQFLLEQKI